ncbi:MAG: hypothetical protein ACLP5V_07795 [Candidatus Bathyarchaeia archaeon]
MKPETKAELDRVLNSYDVQLNEKQRTAEQVKQEEQQFRSGVNTLCKETIRPAMEEVGAALRQRGHDYVIKDAEKVARMHSGHMSNLILGMAIIPKDTKRIELEEEELLPHILVGLETEQRKIRFGYPNTRTNMSSAEATFLAQ